MPYNRALVFTAACMGMLLFGIVLISLGSLLPQIIARFGLDPVQAGSLASVLAIGAMIGNLVFGPLVDRFGFKLLLIICTALLIGGMEGLAFSTRFLGLNLSMGLLGFCGGAINGATNALVADISTSNKGANLSLLGTFFGLGALAMPAILALLLPIFELREIVSWMGMSMLIPLGYFMIITFPQPKLSQSFPFAESLKLLKNPSLLGFGAILFFQGGLEGVANNWATTYLENHLAIDSSKALYVLTLLVLALTLSRMVLSRLLRIIPDRVVFGGSLMVTLLGILLLIGAKSYPLALLAWMVFGAGVAGIFPMILGWVGMEFSKISGTAFSLVIMFGIFGNMLFNYLMGLISNEWGWQAFPYLLLVLLLGIVCMTPLNLPKRN